MNDIKISIIQYLLLLEIILSENIREPLKFLGNGLDTIHTLETKFRERKHRKEQQNVKRNKGKAVVYIPTYSYLDWSWNDDDFNYYRSVRKLVFEKQPIRPLIPLSTRSLKWKIEGTEICFLSATKKIELSLLLICKIKKRINIRPSEKIEEVLPTYLSFLRRKCNQEKINNVKKILNGIFEITQQINVQASDSIAIIELSDKVFEKLKLDIKKSDLIKFENVKIYFEKHNKIYLVYKGSTHKIFRSRVFKVVSLVLSLKFLIERVRNLIDMGILENLLFKQKANFLEYILVSLNPANYSSRKKLNLLVNHYQRIIFSELTKKIDIKGNFRELKHSLQKKIEEMSAYESALFFSRKSIFTNRLRDEIVIKLAAQPEPELEDKERIMLDFLIDEYNDKVVKEGMIGMKVKRERIPGSITRNQIREKINPWLKNKGLPTSTFTETELKKSMPDVIYKLGTKDLIIIDKKVRGRTGFLICLNDENKFIIKEIIRTI